MRTTKAKFQDLDQLITKYVDLQYPGDDEMFSMPEAEAQRRGEQARGVAEQVVALLFDTGLHNVIRKRAGRES
jgi:hypothetical protein